MLVHDLRIPDTEGRLQGIVRLDAGPNETRETVKLVGVVEQGYTMEYLWGAISRYHGWRVIALNANAEGVLGDAEIHEVPGTRISVAYRRDLPLEFSASEIP